MPANLRLQDPRWPVTGRQPQTELSDDPDFPTPVSTRPQAPAFVLRSRNTGLPKDFGAL